MLFSIPLIFAIIPVMNSSIIIVYGTMSNYEECFGLNDTIWNVCVSQCARNQSCSFAYKLDTSTCYLCDNLYGLISITQNQIENEVALKLSSENEQCPDILQNIILPGNYTYAVNGSFFNISPNQEKSCATDWTPFTRPNGVWCLKVFAADNDTYTYDDAINYCKQFDSVLSGLETTNETSFANSEIRKHPIINGEKWRLWVSGRRRPKCQHTNFTNTYCKKFANFNHTDNYLTNYGGYQWSTGQPDRTQVNKTSQDCLLMWSIPTVSSISYSNENMKIDDGYCDDFYHTTDGFLCGKIPDT